MGVLKRIRKIGKLLRGGATPAEIFLGALFGCVLGMVPGFNAVVLLLVFLLVLLNANMGVAFLCYGIAKPLSLLLAPVTFRFGYFLIHNAGLAELIRRASDTPVLAFMELHVYCVLGGILFGTAGGLVAGFVTARLLSAFRKGILEPAERSQGMKKIMNFFLVRFVMWLAFGSRKAAQEEVLHRKFKLFRRSGLIVAVIAVILVAGVEYLLMDWLLAVGVEKGVGSVVGAEADAEDASVSLIGASAELRGLQVTDPAEPEKNLIQAKGIQADISVKSLLANRYVVDGIEVAEVRLGTDREKPGEVYQPPEEPEPEDKESVSLPGYFQDGRKILDYLRKAEDYLGRYERKAQPPVSPQEEGERERQRKSRLLSKAENRGFFNLSAQDVLAEKPAFVIRRLGVKDLAFSDGGRPWHLEVSGLSSHPHLADQPLLMRLYPQGEMVPLVDVGFYFHQPERPHSIKISLPGVPVGGKIKLSEEAPVVIRDGKADISVDGTFTSGKLDVPFSITVNGLKAELREGRTLFGMNRATSEQVLEALTSLSLVGRVYGSLSRPRLHIDAGKTLAGIHAALARAGREELMQRVNEQRQKVERQVRGKVEETREQAAEKIEEAKSMLQQEAQKAKDEAVEKIQEEIDKTRKKAGEEAGKALEDLFGR